MPADPFSLRWAMHRRCFLTCQIQSAKAFDTVLRPAIVTPLAWGNAIKKARKAVGQTADQAI
ncbi:hypothetical protein DEA98_27975 [Brucella pseudogrignonensis]|nr:hypothetical protein [Brucella pseudogrignonensis]